LKLDEKIKQVIGDIRDIEFLSKTIDEFQPEIVFHLAAQPIVRESYENPVYTIQTNAI
jgi:CDP-glucose 4,6-dehydratase